MATQAVRRTIAHRCATGLFRILAVAVVLFVSGWVATLLFPVVVPEGGANPQGTALTPAGVEVVQNALRRQWWAVLAISLVLWVLVFHLVPLAWRRWRAH